jgi:hypothetical protein
MTATYDKIQSTTLGSNQTTVTLSTIPSTYTDLVLVCDPSATSDGATIFFRINGDTASNYSFTELSGNGSSAASGRASSATRIDFGGVVGVSSTLGNSNLIIHLMNYANTTTNKTIIGRLNNGSSGSFPGTAATVGLWRSTSAITSISFTTNAAQQKSGATFTLYGIKAA